MFIGTGTALVTPFRRDGSLDEPALRSLVKRQIDAGIDFLVPCGTTGESPTLKRAEHLRVVEITLELAKGKVPVLAGAGGYNTAEVIDLAQRTGGDGREWNPFRDAVLQQAHAGRTVSAFQGDCVGGQRASDFVQRAGSHGSEYRAGHGAEVGKRGKYYWYQGSVWEYGADGHDPELRAGRFYRAVGRRFGDAAGDFAGRARRDFRRVERNSGGNDEDGAAGAGRRFREAPGKFTGVFIR